MELCSMFLLFAAVILVFLVACVVNSDADLTLMFADKFGRKLGNDWSKKCTARSSCIKETIFLFLKETSGER